METINHIQLNLIDARLEQILFDERNSNNIWENEEYKALINLRRALLTN